MKARSQIKKHAKPHGNLLKMLQLVKFNLLFLQLDNDQNKYIIILLKLLSQNFNWTISRDKLDFGNMVHILCIHPINKYD